MSDPEDYDDNDDNEELEESASKRKKEDDEDIWPEDVEKCFQEALKIYPQVGRRKLLENGKLYGRNELIAKFIYAKTGKHRTRKQVSSHIQVLGKKMKKATEGMPGEASTSKTPSKSMDPKDYQSSLTQVPFRPVPSQEPAYQMGRPVILMKYFSSFFERADSHYSGMVNRHVYAHLFCENPTEIFLGQLPTIPINHIENQFAGLRNLFDRGTSTHFYLAKMSLNLNSDRSSGLHSLSVKYESNDSLTVKCSTTVYSFGKPVVEKIQVEEPYVEASTNAYYFNHSPMCDYMVQFAEKLRSLSDPVKMNKVLDNFSVLQVLVDPRNNTILMATAFLFSIGTTHVLENQIFRITRPA